MDNTKAISIKNLIAKFEDCDKDLHVLSNINFEVKNGSFISVIGPSGCGKSTLFSLISGLPTKDTCKTEGKIRIYGKKPDTARKNREIGLILQKPTLLEWRTVEENIKLPLEIMGYSKDKQEEQIRRLLKLLDLQGYEKYRPSQISGGMQQKVSVGRALAYNPDLLLMDEPFGALDEINRRKINEEIIKIWQKTKKTILFITHSIEETVYLSQKVIILSSKPSTVHKIVNINLPYPRKEAENSTKYFNYIKEVREYLDEASNRK
jgi:NitT/TauT family transport system ATP-binding protein